MYLRLVGNVDEVLGYLPRDIVFDESSQARIKVLAQPCLDRLRLRVCQRRQNTDRDELRADGCEILLRPLLQ